MDIRQLAALVAVGEHQSFSAAARSLHTVQSNVSAHIAKLEAELGVVLVDRSNGSFTDAGELVAARARRIQAEIDALGDDLTSTLHSVAGSVRLGMIGTTARWLVPLVVPEVGRRHPRVTVTITDATTTSLVPQLLGRTLDLAVVNLPVHSQDISTTILFEENLVVVAPLNHPLSKHTQIDVRELADFRLLLSPKGTAFRDELDAETQRVGVDLIPAAEVDGVRLLATLAFEGFGAAIVPASAARPRDDAPWKLVAINGIAPRAVGLALERRALLSNAARAVQHIISELCDSYAPTYVSSVA